MKPNFWLRCQPELSHHIRTSWRDQWRVKLWSDIQFGTSFSPIPSKGINQRQPSLNHLPSLHLSFFQFTFTSKSCYLKNKTKTKQVERCLISLTFGLKLCDLDFAERSYLFFLSFFFLVFWVGLIFEILISYNLKPNSYLLILIIYTQSLISHQANMIAFTTLTTIFISLTILNPALAATTKPKPEPNQQRCGVEWGVHDFGDSTKFGKWCFLVKVWSSTRVVTSKMWDPIGTYSDFFLLLSLSFSSLQLFSLS